MNPFNWVDSRSESWTDRSEGRRSPVKVTSLSNSKRRALRSVTVRFKSWVGTGVQVSLEVRLPPEQTKPGSIVQVGLHPSPESRFPSSHSLIPKFKPSPHFSRQLP